MTFLSLSIEKSVLTQEKNEYEYELIVATDNYNYAAKLVGILDDDTTIDKTSEEYQELQAFEQQYDRQKAVLENQLEAINAELESFDKAVQTNVKSECKLTISV